MPVAVLTVLKFCLVALIFLFLARVLRAVWVEISAPAPDASLPSSAALDQPAPQREVSQGRGRRARREMSSGLALVVVDPIEQRGQRHELATEMTLGRAPGCAIVITDSFASQLHARIFQRDDEWFVEDLGSRNGTWLNRDQVHGPTRIERGDRVKVGDTVLEVSS